MAVVSVFSVVTVNKLDGNATMAFAVMGGAPFTVYTYTRSTGLVTASALTSPYEITTLNYIDLVRALSGMLYQADQQLGPRVFPSSGPSWKITLDVNRSSGKASMTTHVGGPKYADVDAGLVLASSTINIKSRPAISFDRTAFAIYQGSHERFAALLGGLGNVVP